MSSEYKIQKTIFKNIKTLVPSTQNKMPLIDKKILEEKIIEQLKTVHDPEIPVDIYELGLIYELEIYPPLNNVYIKMTVTAPNCPVADTLPVEVQVAVEQVEGVGDVQVEMTFDPPWTKDRMSELAQLELDMF